MISKSILFYLLICSFYYYCFMISVLIFCVLNVPNHFLCCFDALAIQNVFFVMPIKLSELN